MTAAARADHHVFEITGGTKVVCPVGRNLITPYVLEEQQDWFEDEIRFMRAIIKPDGVFIDIGANFGLYALSAAKLSPQGRVWAYEPSGQTAACLKTSIAENRFDNITLTPQAMSDKTGPGWLQDMGSPELNALGEASGSNNGEPITLTTLDIEQQTHDWRRVDIVKLDVEGHEANVVAGGQQFFSTASPLVMLEIKAGESVDLEATRRLIDLGYRCWRLVPGLGALAPQDPGKVMDDYQLNVFCCKPDRAAALARAGRLVQASDEPTPHAAAPRDAWQDFTGAFMYAERALDAWTDQAERQPLDGWEVYREALDLYALSMDPAQPVAARYDALCASHADLRTLLKTQANAPRLLSFVRIATDLGMRRHAVEALRFVINSANGYTPADFLREPFLSPSAEFDAIAPHGALREWALAAVLEAFERLRYFSSFFSDPESTLAITGELRRRGYMTPQMQRRMEMVQRRKG